MLDSCNLSFFLSHSFMFSLFYDRICIKSTLHFKRIFRHFLNPLTLSKSKFLQHFPSLSLQLIAAQHLQISSRSLFEHFQVHPIFFDSSEIDLQVHKTTSIRSSIKSQYVHFIIHSFAYFCRKEGDTCVTQIGYTNITQNQLLLLNRISLSLSLFLFEYHFSKLIPSHFKKLSKAYISILCPNSLQIVLICTSNNIFHFL